MEEQWKDIKEYEGRYQVSTKGRIRSLKRAGHSTPDRAKPKIKSQSSIGKEYKRENSYKAVSLWKNNKEQNRRVHRLVAEAFIPNPNNKKIVNHKNGIKHDNRVDNLEWVTAKENYSHAVDNGLYPRGEESYMSKLDKTDVIEIRCAYRLGCFSYSELANAYNVHTQNIASIIRRESWKHV